MIVMPRGQVQDGRRALSEWPATDTVVQHAREGRLEFEVIAPHASDERLARSVGTGEPRAFEDLPAVRKPRVEAFSIGSAAKSRSRSTPRDVTSAPASSAFMTARRPFCATWAAAVDHFAR